MARQRLFPAGPAPRSSEDRIMRILSFLAINTRAVGAGCDRFDGRYRERKRETAHQGDKLNYEMKSLTRSWPGRLNPGERHVQNESIAGEKLKSPQQADKAEGPAEKAVWPASPKSGCDWPRFSRRGRPVNVVRSSRKGRRLTPPAETFFLKMSAFDS